MITRLVEVTNGVANWGKFLVGAFDDEWRRMSVVSTGYPLLGGRGWSRDHVLVLDLQTGEGAVFKPGGIASADLDKHKIWVCPLYQPFLEWLYEQARTNPRYLVALPDHVDLPNAPFAMAGYRRPGPEGSP